MVVWRGKGIVALLFLGLGYIIVDSFLRDFATTEDLEIALSLLIAAPLTFAAGRYWNRPRIINDPNTGQDFEYTPKNSLFWIPMQYWGIIMLALGALFYFMD